MKIKAFITALYHESAKRVPYVLGLLLILLLIQGVLNIRAIRETSTVTKGLVKQQKTVLDKQQQSLDNQAKIISNLTQAVKDLKKDNSQQTDYIQCLLALNGHPVANQCVRTQSTQPSPAPSTKSTQSTSSLSADKNQPKQKPKAVTEEQAQPPNQAKLKQPNFITKLLRSIGL